ncbi:MAG: hypothetical protein CME06_06440 [Gemmatimonadetes bacterium]|nr:hypothetical protein [Gemmatimonadota bacterium]
MLGAPDALRAQEYGPIESGEAVQIALTALGYDPGPIDGIVGPRTRGAIVEFQVAHELPEDGEADLATINAIVAQLNLGIGDADPSRFRQDLFDALMNTRASWDRYLPPGGEFEEQAAPTLHAEAAAAGEEPAPPLRKSFFRGNTKTKVFHHYECRYFDCKHCTEPFNTEQGAVDAGYRACKLCSIKDE